MWTVKFIGESGRVVTRAYDCEMEARSLTGFLASKGCEWVMWEGY